MDLERKDVHGQRSPAPLGEAEDRKYRRFYRDERLRLLVADTPRERLRALARIPRDLPRDDEARARVPMDLRPPRDDLEADAREETWREMPRLDEDRRLRVSANVLAAADTPGVVNGTQLPLLPASLLAASWSSGFSIRKGGRR